MTILTEGRHVGGFITWEALRDYCREVVTIAAGTLEPGTHRFFVRKGDIGSAPTSLQWFLNTSR